MIAIWPPRLAQYKQFSPKTINQLILLLFE